MPAAVRPILGVGSNGKLAGAVPGLESVMVLHPVATLFDGPTARPADGVARLLGRPPRDVAEFALAAAQRRAWSA